MTRIPISPSMRLMQGSEEVLPKKCFRYNIGRRLMLDYRSWGVRTARIDRETMVN